MLCEGEAYDGNAPTKQNLLCQGRAPLHVIREQMLTEEAAFHGKDATVVQSNVDSQSNNRDEAI